MSNTPNVRSAIPLSRLLRARRSFLEMLDRTRKRVAHPSARTTLAILRAQQEATLDGILVVDAAGRVLSHNRRFREIWKIPDELAKNADDQELLGYVSDLVRDWPGFISTVQYLYDHPEEVRTADIVELNDGRVLSRASLPVRSDGSVTGRSWYFRDVTPEKKAERLQAALFRIAQLTRETENLDDFYAAIHRVIGGLMDATNFYIAAYEAARDILLF